MAQGTASPSHGDGGIGRNRPPPTAATAAGAKKKKRYPIPVSATLRNMFVPPPSTAPSPSEDDAAVGAGGGIGVGVGVGVESPVPLLSRARLEIVADRSSSSAAAAADDDGGSVGPGIAGAGSFDRDDGFASASSMSSADVLGGSSRETVYSSLSRGPASPHPQWDHLDERVGLFDRNRGESGSRGRGDGGRVDGDGGDWDGMYRSLRARVVVDAATAAAGNTDAVPKTPYDDRREGQAAAAVVVLAEVPLHPTQLRRLPRDASAEGGGVGADDPSSSVGGGGDGARHSTFVAPSSLPPNAILLRHSDGATRVAPSLHRLLLRRGVISKADPRELDADAAEELEEERRRERRFDDDVFGLLDAAAEGGGIGEATGGGGQRRRRAAEEPRPSPSSLLVKTTTEGRASASADRKAAAATAFSDDDLFDLLGSGGGSGKATVRADPGGGRGMGLDRSVEESAFELEDVFPSRQDFPMLSDGPKEVETTEQEETPVSAGIEERHPQDVLPLESEVHMNDLSAEVEELQMLLREEEEELEREEAFMKTELEDLEFLMQEVKRIEAEAAYAKQDAEDEIEKLARSEFALECRRIKLLRDLRSIYPIRRLPHNVFTVRDVHLPSDLHSLSASDALISAALGFVCHLVFMASKYLSVPLRYRLVPNSSRSAVQDDGRGVLPLFKERGAVEREQFDRGVALLDRDVECLLRSRGVRYDPRWHLLAKVDRLFEVTTEVGTAGGGGGGGDDDGAAAAAL